MIQILKKNGLNHGCELSRSLDRKSKLSLPPCQSWTFWLWYTSSLGTSCLPCLLLYLVLLTYYKKLKDRKTCKNNIHNIIWRTLNCCYETQGWIFLDFFYGSCNNDVIYFMKWWIIPILILLCGLTRLFNEYIFTSLWSEQIFIKLWLFVSKYPNCTWLWLPLNYTFSCKTNPLSLI